ncbi:hypothetical protein GDO86_010025 [Hymenochirus boettgeri]|uniref:Cystatin fetuin-A-type domain-containing protein n=1 Tax=Hymenochirus boettgeri TaxID=247094 RepID=A0A8T2JMV3_9PIPI|nr:hypothetical protein GDO86_010025 [Hymenochirus boettgeri]
MKLLLLSLLLAESLLCTAFLVATKPSSRIINCDDPEAHEAALEALHYINAHHHHGYKHALNRVENVNILSETANGEIMLMELDLLETKCPWVSPTPVESCPVRPIIEQAVEGDCKVKLQKQNGSFTVLGVRCKSEPDSAENIHKVCTTCPLLALLNNTQVTHAVDQALLHFNRDNSTVFYRLHEIGRAQIQGAPENRVSVEFIIAASNCSIEEANSALDSCVVLTGDGAGQGQISHKATYATA